MTSQRIAHGSFSIERIYDACAAEIFAAWSSLESRALWFIGPQDWTAVKRELDFRVGGQELLHGRFPSGRETLYTARFHAIVPDTRIVYVYDMHLGSIHHSLSLATVELEAVGDRARLVFTEQVAFLDGTAGEEGTSSRARGTAVHLDRLQSLHS